MPTPQFRKNGKIKLKNITFTYRQIVDGINAAIVPELLDEGILQSTDIHLAIPPPAHYSAD